MFFTYVPVVSVIVQMNSINDLRYGNIFRVTRKKFHWTPADGFALESKSEYELEPPDKLPLWDLIRYLNTGAVKINLWILQNIVSVL